MISARTKERRPIPKPPVTDGWKTVPISESGQKLVLLNELHPRIVVDPMYFKTGIPNTSPNAYLREQLTDKLIKAAESLPDYLGLVIFDAYRPTAVQQALFDDFYKSISGKSVFPNESELLVEVQKYVSLPSDYPDRPSPHSTGGAVDLSIIDLSTKRLLPMGTEFDHFGDEANTNYFEGSGQEEIINNRRMLYWCMQSQDISNWPFEWWHHDFGNQFYGRITGERVIYGRVAVLPEHW